MDENQEQNTQSNSWNEYFESHREKWSNIIKALAVKLKNLPDILDLQPELFAKRQDAVDYYYTMLNQLSWQKDIYNKAKAAEYNRLKTSAQIRYTTEASINAQVDANLADTFYIINMISNHVNYMKDIIKQLDSLDFAINRRIELQKLIDGVKK
jgi:hypothetical protein